VPTVAPVAYVLDGQDNISLVNDEWDRFALANHAPELAQGRVVGTSLWQHVSDPTLRYLLAALLARVRSKRTPVSLPFRCDSPALRREMELRIAPGHAGALLLSAQTVALWPRDPVPLLDPAVARDERLLRVCSWCRRTELDGVWLEIEEALTAYRDLLASPPVPRITHGLCATCMRRIEEP
jgi:hypothetical protein